MALPVHFLPSIGWWAHAAQHSPGPLAGAEYYVRQGGHNRTWVAGPAGLQLLTVPTGRPHPGTPLAQVPLPAPKGWAPAMGRGLRTAYGQAPFWEHYGPDVTTLLHRPFTHLWHLNLALIAWLADALGLALGPVLPAVHQPWLLPSSELPPGPPLASHYPPQLTVLHLLLHLGPESPAYLKRFTLPEPSTQG